MNHEKDLLRSLSLRDAMAIVVGSMIGTGIFLKTAVMTQALGSVVYVTLAWVTAGVLSLFGALTYAELGSLFPHSGGGYTYIREAYGRPVGFLAGWISFWIMYPGSIAAYAVASSTFLAGLIPTIGGNGSAFISVAFIVLFSLLNSLTVAVGGVIQSLLTTIKVVLILLLGVGLFFFTSEPQLFLSSTSSAGLSPSWGAFGMATLSALWAFDGWEAIARIAGEVNDPQRTLPKALIFGTLAVLALYLILNLSYFWTLPLHEIVTANSTSFPEGTPVATRAALRAFGPSVARALSALLVISAIGALNGCILTSARIPFAMANDGLFFKPLATLHKKRRVPILAIWMQCLISSLLALSGTFDQLTNYVIFSGWIFYGLTGGALFIFRYKLENTKRSFKVPLYPWVPGLFVLSSLLLVLNTILESPHESLIGLLMISLGLPFYLVLYRKS